MVFLIGEFSKIAQVTARQLRFYDHLGLLVPQQVELDGRRYYAARQLPRLHRILAFKALGFSLEQIGLLLDQNVTPEEMRGMLRLQQAESERRIEEELRRYRAIEARLNEITRGLDASLDVVLKPLMPERWMSIRQTVASLEEAQTLFKSIVRLLSSPQFLKEGPFTGILHSEEIAADELDVEIGRILRSTSLAATSLPPDLVVRELPALDEVAAVVHHGPHDQILLAYATLGQWLERNQYHIRGPLREVFIHLPLEADESDAITEVQVPVGRGEQRMH